VFINIYFVDRLSKKRRCSIKKGKYPLIEGNSLEIVNSIEQGIDIVDSKGTILFMNEKFLKIFGKKAIGKKCWEVYKIDKKQCVNCPLRSKINVGKSKTIIVSGILGNKTFSITHKGIRLQDGSVAVLEMFQDVTEEKKVEEELKESEEKFRSWTENSPVGIYYTTPEGNCLYANKKWLEFAGLSFSEALGKGWVKGLHPDDKVMVFKKWSKMVQSDGKWDLEYRFRNLKRGKVTWVSGTANKIIKEGKLIGYVGTNKEITSQKEAIEKLQDYKDNLTKIVQEKTAELQKK